MGGNSPILRAFVVAVLVLVSSGPARAERCDNADTKAMLARGKQLAAADKLEESCQSLVESTERCMDRFDLHVALAGCREKQGRLAAAFKAYSDAAAAARRNGNAGQASRAQDAGRALLGRFAKLTVDVPAASRLSGLVISIDGTPFPEEQYGKEVAVDPGGHEVTANVAGRTPWQQTVTLAPKGKATVVVPILAVLPKVVPPDPTVDPTVDPNKPPVDPTKPDTPKPKPTASPILATSPVAYDHLLAKKYQAVRTDRAPTLDGILDDEVWKTAPIDTSFGAEDSDPYGEPTTNPTSFQLVYTDKTLYVAVRCSYVGNKPPAEAPALRYEADFGEFVAVYIDAEHDHSTSRSFVLSPRGYRADWETWNNGAQLNMAWNGIWEGETHHDAKGGWTAEFAIPWGTVGVLPTAGPLQIGINFRRFIPPANVQWSLPPPGSPRPLPSYYGHIDGLRDIAASNLLVLQPYFALGYSTFAFYRRDVPRSRLQDFDRDGSPLEPYAGMSGQLHLDRFVLRFAINPDFSQASPDAALSNLDRFELFFPEVREFFVETTPDFSFGSLPYQLFYSRRIGLRRRSYGFEGVPIFYGAEATYRAGKTNVAVLDTMTDELAGPIELGRDTTVYRSHSTVGRAQYVDGANRIGAIALNQSQPWSVSSYRAAGVDGAMSLYKDHLTLDGFYAFSDKLFQTKGIGAAAREPDRDDFERLHDTAWQLSAGWRAREFRLSTAYLDVGTDFSADLGFFQRTNVRRIDADTSYRPQLNRDLVRSLAIGAAVSQLRTRTTDRVEAEKARTYVEGTLSDGTTLAASVTRTLDQPTSTFFLADNRLRIPAGSYPGVVTNVSISTAEQRAISGTLSAEDGDFFGGTRRVLSPDVFLRFGTLAARLTYQYFEIRPGSRIIYPAGVDQDEPKLRAHRVSARLVFAPTTEFVISGAVEVNTFDPRATTQLVASWRLKALTNLVLVLNRTSLSIDEYNDEPSQIALIKITYGLGVP
ncbi:MAG: DUF5916 domain-containing protein [Kofleriaceae bacterium]